MDDDWTNKIALSINFEWRSCHVGHCQICQKFPPLVPPTASPDVSLKTHTHTHTHTPNPFPHSSHKLQASKQVAGKKTNEEKKNGFNFGSFNGCILTYLSQKKVAVPSSEAFFKPLPLRPSKAKGVVAPPKPNARSRVRASMKEKAVTGLTAVALTASLMAPDVAEAAITPSLKNFLLSIVAAGVVVGVLVGAVIGVANFDPVKRS